MRPICKVFAAIAVLFAATPVLAQAGAAKPLPDRGETSAYLNKKIAETEGLTFFSPSIGINYLIKSISFGVSESKATINNTTNVRPGTCNEENIAEAVTFNPAQIIAVSESRNNSSDSLGFALVKLSAKGAKLVTTSYRYRSKKAIPNSTVFTAANPYCSDFGAAETTSSTRDNFTFVFLKGDPANFDRIRKALFHLRDLDKAADNDPFK